MRVRIVEKYDTRPNSEFGRFNTHGPIRTFEECAQILKITKSMAEYAELCAFQKIAAALSAFGYHKETTR